MHNLKGISCAMCVSYLIMYDVCHDVRDGDGVCVLRCVDVDVLGANCECDVCNVTCMCECVNLWRVLRYAYSCAVCRHEQMKWNIDVWHVAMMRGKLAG